MKRAWIVAVLSLAAPDFGQTARSYFDELYKAGGLDRMASAYVCFDDELSNQNFFIFDYGNNIRQALIESGIWKKMSKADQQHLKGDFLIAHVYTKGVPAPQEDFYNKEGKSWVVNDVRLGGTTNARVRITISWPTLRYRHAVEILNHDSSLKKEISGFGRCEPISQGIEQKE